tara:strand:+ start:2543 stop:3718 length:1176 start_codon:yes stop_codon:yes gene_type:complete
VSLFVNTNTSSLNATRQLFNANSSLDKSFQRLSSGFRINSASDDAAGLQISDRMTAQVNGLKQAARNVNDGISLVQVADGALKETVTILKRIKQLSVQAQNGINSDSDRLALFKEFWALTDEMDRIAETRFSDKFIFDGQFSASFAVGANAGQSIDVSLRQFDGYFDALRLGLSNLDIGNDLNGAGFINAEDANAAFPSAFAPNQIVFGNVPVGFGNFLAVSDNSGETYKRINYLFEEGITATDIVKDVNKVLGKDVLYVSGNDVRINGSQPSFRLASTGSGGATVYPGVGLGAPISNLSNDALGTIDNAISSINGIRADLGATQNRFQSALRSLSNTEENVSAARSRIMDADYALETANLTKHQIIQQAATSVLAQANTRPQIALSLLGE